MGGVAVLNIINNIISYLVGFFGTTFTLFTAIGCIIVVIECLVYRIGRSNKNNRRVSDDK